MKYELLFPGYVALKIGHNCTNEKANMHPKIHDIMNNKAVHLVYMYYIFFILKFFLLGSFETSAYFLGGLTDFREKIFLLALVRSTDILCAWGLVEYRAQIFLYPLLPLLLTFLV